MTAVEMKTLPSASLRKVPMDVYNVKERHMKREVQILAPGSHFICQVFRPL